MFSTFYLALVVVLVALIVRGVSFEFNRKIDNPRWRSTWRWSLTIGSLLIPLLLGTALGDLLHGLPIDSSHNYTGTFFGLLVPFGLYTGVTLTVLCLFLGAAYLTLKTEGALHDRVATLSGRLGWLAVVITFGWLTWMHVGLSVGFVPNPIEALALVAVVGRAPGWPSRGSEGWAFTAAAVAIGSVVGSIFFELFPRVMVSTTNAAYNLTVANSASPSYTLKVMTVVAVVFFPVVLAYQGWSLYVFRKRLTTPPPGPTADGPAPGADPRRCRPGPRSAETRRCHHGRRLTVEPDGTVGGHVRPVLCPDRPEPPAVGRPETVCRAGGRPPTRWSRCPAGRYRMGDESEWSYPGDGEGPVHDVELASFRIDRYAVTNRDFAAFVEATGWRTDAERFGWSFVFGGLLPDEFPPTRGVEGAPWWRQVMGADWRHPEGPQSDTAGRSRPPGGPRVVERRPGLLRVVGHPAAHRGRMGGGGPGRPRRPAVPLGRRARARGRPPDERLPGGVPRRATPEPTGTSARPRSTPSSPTATGSTT